MKILKRFLVFAWPLLVIGLLFGVRGLLDRQGGAGAELYATHCANCHMDDGSGLGALIPPLAGADYVLRSDASLACVLRYGIADTLVVNGQRYTQPMAGVETLAPAEVAALLNYIRSAWGNDLAPLPYAAVAAALDSCATRP
ncbi:MAG: hypothetical protein OHK0039_11410 [Bacteroidia bacterium]